MTQGSSPVDGELAGLFDLSLDAFCIAGFDGYLKRVNPAFARMLGYTQEELLARPFMDHVHPDDVESVSAVLAELAQGKDIVGLETREVCADGSVRWLEWNTRTRPEEGVVYGVGRDVTARHVANAELSALRRIATLVAGGVQPHDLFAVVAEEIARVVNVPIVSIARYEVDGTATQCATFSTEGRVFRAGVQWLVEGESVLGRVRASSTPARIDDVSQLKGELGEAIRRVGIRSGVGVPIVAAGRLWGAVVVSSTEPEPLPEDTEARLADFTELIATAIANAESREALERLADEQAALRRAATLVVQGVRPAEIFSAVSDEVGRLFASDTAAVVRFEHDPPAIIVVGVGQSIPGIPIGARAELGDGLASTEVYRTGRSARVDTRDWASAPGPIHDAGRRLGLASTVASPIIVQGRLWGTISVSAKEPFPLDTEARLERFTELLATAIANAESREALGQLADEQAALRRVATLVALGVRPKEIFAAVSDEAGRLFGANAGVVRFEPEEAIVFVGVGKTLEGLPVGTRWDLDDSMASTQVYRTGRPARVDAVDWSSRRGPVAQAGERLGVASTVASPIIVDGRRWGAMTISSGELLPIGIEDRLERFTELVATAIANAESREALGRLADEQAALRRVATLVARGVRPAEIFAAVSEEVDRLFGLDEATVGRFDPDGPAFVVVGVARSVEGISVGSRWELNPLFASMKVLRTGRSARVEAKDLESVGGPVAADLRRLGLISTVASPIIVEGHLWGAITVVANEESVPLDTEERLEKFAELVATAIANAESKSELAASRTRIVAASDGARRRIERDLHDGTQQRLVSLGLAVRAAEADTPPDRTDLRSQLSRIATGLADAVAELQEISRGIHPANLSRGGLRTALRTLARRSPIPIELDVTTDTRLPEPIEVAAYYVASEAVANATKHAHASHIEVSLGRRNGCLLLSIRDDGVGGADAERGSGLTGLTDRVEALGGSIRVRSRPGAGTEITAELPVELKLSKETD